MTYNLARYLKETRITWYNPPFRTKMYTPASDGPSSKSSTNHLDHILHKILNRSTVEVSYGYMPNLKLSAHTKYKLAGQHFQ